MTSADTIYVGPNGNIQLQKGSVSVPWNCQILIKTLNRISNYLQIILLNNTIYSWIIYTILTVFRDLRNNIQFHFKKILLWKISYKKQACGVFTSSSPKVQHWWPENFLEKHYSDYNGRIQPCILEYRRTFSTMDTRPFKSVYFFYLTPENVDCRLKSVIKSMNMLLINTFYNWGFTSRKMFLILFMSIRVGR